MNVVSFPVSEDKKRNASREELVLLAHEILGSRIADATDAWENCDMNQLRELNNMEFYAIAKSILLLLLEVRMLEEKVVKLEQEVIRLGGAA